MPAPRLFAAPRRRSHSSPRPAGSPTAAPTLPPSIRPSAPRRIAFAGGDTILIPGSLQDNLLYGCPAGQTDLDSASPKPWRSPASTA